MLSRLVGCLAASLIGCASAQSTFYVNGSCGDDSWTGTSDVCQSPTGPKRTIQAGIGASSTSDTVIVADGTYTGNGNRDLDFGGRDIHLRSESLDPVMCIIDCQGTAQNPHRGFLFQNGETNAAVVDGFTIRNGYVTIDSPGIARGGGVYCWESSPTINNCTLSENTADASNGAGGAIYSFGSPLISNCTITQNEVIGGCCTGGGGVTLVRSGTIIGCAITNNTSEGVNGGGGIRALISAQQHMTISDCVITDNVSGGGQGGGIVMSGGGSGTISNCLISRNHSGSSHNGLGVGGGIMALADENTVADCIITANTADREGGGIYAARSTIVNCVISANSSQGEGGGIFFRGGNAAINTVIVDNTSSIDGGGAYCWWAATFTNCTIAGNTAANHGGGIVADALESGVVTVNNTVLWGNAAQVGPELAVFGILNVNYSDIEGGRSAVHVRDFATLDWGLGNIDANPGFKDPSNDDYHIGAGSPAIDAADNTGVPADEADLDGDGDTLEPVPFDLDANPRFVDDPDTDDTGVAGNGYDEVVDMGSYEFQITCPADIDGDGDLDAEDFFAYLDLFANGDDGADIDGDGDIDAEDFFGYLDLFVDGC